MVTQREKRESTGLELRRLVWMIVAIMCVVRGVDCVELHPLKAVNLTEASGRTALVERLHKLESLRWEIAAVVSILIKVIHTAETHPTEELSDKHQQDLQTVVNGRRIWAFSRTLAYQISQDLLKFKTAKFEVKDPVRVMSHAQIKFQLEVYSRDIDRFYESIIHSQADIAQWKKGLYGTAEKFSVLLRKMREQAFKAEGDQAKLSEAHSDYHKTRKGMIFDPLGSVNNYFVQEAIQFKKGLKELEEQEKIEQQLDKKMNETWAEHIQEAEDRYTNFGEVLSNGTKYHYGLRTNYLHGVTTFNLDSSETSWSYSIYQQAWSGLSRVEAGNGTNHEGFKNILKVALTDNMNKVSEPKTNRNLLSKKIWRRIKEMDRGSNIAVTLTNEDLTPAVDALNRAFTPELNVQTVKHILSQIRKCNNEFKFYELHNNHRWRIFGIGYRFTLDVVVIGCPNNTMASSLGKKPSTDITLLASRSVVYGKYKTDSILSEDTLRILHRVIKYESYNRLYKAFLS